MAPTPIHLACEDLVDPLAIGVRAPRLRWRSRVGRHATGIPCGYESEWRREGRALTCAVRVPPNCDATAWLPTDQPGSATEGGRPLSEGEGLRVVGAEGRCVVLALGSGSYRFASVVDPAPSSNR